ncbi:MAG: hypothetical protein NVSMB39_6270 [Candidatus Saccharimonadales bacterium]
MTKVTISEASPRSLGALNKLLTEAVTGHFDYFSEDVQHRVVRDHSIPKLFLAMVDPQRVVLTAKHEGRLIGYAIGSAPAVGPAQLFWLYVNPQYRGANTGLSLLSRMLKMLSAKGAKQVSIATHDHRKYYERQGFKFVEHRQVHGVGMDILLFKLGK